MDKNTGYMIAEDNISLVATVSGRDLSTIRNSMGWVAVYVENPYPDWKLMPKNVAEQIPGFRYVDTVLNGLPSRTEAEIRAEWKHVNDTYAHKQQELREELARATMRETGVIS